MMGAPCPLPAAALFTPLVYTADYDFTIVLLVDPPLALPLALHCPAPALQIVYLIIIADVLVGVPPDYNGLVTNLLGVHDPSGALLSSAAVC